MDAATTEHVTQNSIIQFNKIICTMGYRYRMSQDELAYTYVHAQARMARKRLREGHGDRYL